MEMEPTMVPQIDATNPNPNPDAAALALPNGSTMEQLAAVAKEMGVSLDANGNVAEAQPATAPTAAQPAPVVAPAPTPQAADKPAAPVEVPPKFQNPDGTVNVEKLEKSSLSIDDALARYKAKEKEFQTLQNKVNNPPPGQATQTFVPPQGLSPLEIQAAQDILADAQALGHKMTQTEAVLMARAQVRMNEARLNAELNATEDIRRELDENRRTLELQGLLSKDPDLLTPQTADRIVELRNELRKQNPSASYRDAYVLHLGQLELQRRTGQVLTPTPTGTTAKAPPTPVGPVSRVHGSQVDLSNPKALDDATLLAEVRKVYPNFRNL